MNVKRKSITRSYFHVDDAGVVVCRRAGGAARAALPPAAAAAAAATAAAAAARGGGERGESNSSNNDNDADIWIQIGFFGFDAPACLGPLFSPSDLLGSGRRLARRSIRQDQHGRRRGDLACGAAPRRGLL